MTAPSPSNSTGMAGRQSMHKADDKSKSNIRLALLLGLVAFGFFLVGIYMSVSKAG